MARRIVPLPVNGMLRWYDPQELKARPWIEQLSADQTPTRRLYALARAYVLVSIAVLVVVLVSFDGRPPAVTLGLAFGCVLAAAYLAASNVRMLPSARRRARTQVVELEPLLPAGHAEEQAAEDRLRPTA